MGELFSRRIEPYGVTLPMYRVLAALWESGDQRLSDLATVTTAEISTLSRLIGEMKRKGLVTRSRLEDNGRTVAINLTAKGKTLVEELIPIAVHFEEVASAQAPEMMGRSADRARNDPPAVEKIVLYTGDLLSNAQRSRERRWRSCVTPHASALH
jgi:DNA-binding MarR family transcriptional regulator